jgi:hypothetical protein
MEAQKTSNGQGNTEQNKGNSESQNLTSNYTIEHSNKSTIILSQKQTQRPIEQNRRLRHKSTQL